MTDSYENLIDMIIAVLIIFLFPLLYIGQKNDSLVQTYISAQTISLTGEIRSKGYLTKEMYDLYQEQLSVTGMLYDVKIKHRHLVNEPEYRFRTEEEVKADQDSSYTGTNVLKQVPISTDIPEVDDPVGGPLNTETNESILEKTVNTPADAGHIHTDSCYLGTKHVHTGNSTSGGGCYGTYVSGGYCGAPIASKTTYRNQITRKCTFCMGTVHIVSVSTDVKCTKGHSIVYPTEHIEACDSCDYFFIGPTWDVTTITTCQSTQNYYKLDCGKIEGHYYDQDTEVLAACHLLVSNIVPTNPVQTVAIGDELITTVTATYLDGSTKVVVATADFEPDRVVQNQKVTLTYSYSIGSNNYTKTCTITVTVIPKRKTCENGHTYNLNTDGSDPGCPYCRAWLRSLTIVEPASGKITIYKGTTLAENGVTLLATYLDGHTKYLHNEYVDNLDNQYIGVQTVTISYKGHYVYLTVTTKRNLRLCPVCSRYYELYPDGTDPGCPYCMARTPVFTGNVMTYYSEYNTDSILEELYEGSGIYYFSDRDFIEVSVENGRESLGSRILSLFGTDQSSVHVISSGYIREEVNPL